MRWTPEFSREYMRLWRLKNPTYQRDLKAWKRIEHAKIAAEFMAKKTKKRPVRSSPTGMQREAYPWENEANEA